MILEQHALFHVVPLLVHSHQNHGVLTVSLAAVIEPEPRASRLSQELVQLRAEKHAALVLTTTTPLGLGRGLVERNAVTLRIGKRHELSPVEGRNRAEPYRTVPLAEYASGRRKTLVSLGVALTPETP